MKFKLLLIATLLLTSLSNMVSAQGVTEEIRFKKGESSARIEGSVLRGDRDHYFLTAKSGQALSVFIKSLEKNAVIEIYGEVEGSWTALPGADEGDDATHWEGELPGGGNGRYKIIVGSTRGNASYVLKVKIK
ncbi:MAG: hypothetical protein BWK79_09585 [Beggiatoa sp. IS2]|nr:MAG: hypothetical protein BWK79_09585 [Beggiatoa sp. IS2]